MDVSIIIPVYKRSEWIGKCVERLKAQDFDGRFELVVVDDGSPNEREISAAMEKLLNTSHPTVMYIRNNHRGPSGTRNYGVRASSGGIVCFLDDDSLPDRDWLSTIAQSFRSSQSVAVVSGKTCSYDREAPLPLLLERTVYAGKSWATCNIAYRRTVFDTLGGFDESFKEPSWEDNDLGLRALWAGYTHVYNERAIVYHPHENSLEEYKKKCLLNGRGAARFSLKYLFSKPLWGIGTPFVMSRRLIYGIFPSVWIRKSTSEAYVKFLWSLYSLVGFIGAVSGRADGKN